MVIECPKQAGKCDEQPGHDGRVFVPVVNEPIFSFFDIFLRSR